MHLELSEDALQEALKTAVQKGFEGAFCSWDFTHTVNSGVADLIKEQKVASKIGLEVKKLLTEQHESIIQGAVSKMLPAFETCFENAINLMIRGMLIGMHLNIDETNKYLNNETKATIKKVDALNHEGRL